MHGGHFCFNSNVRTGIQFKSPARVMWLFCWSCDLPVSAKQDKVNIFLFSEKIKRIFSSSYQFCTADKYGWPTTQLGSLLFEVIFSTCMVLCHRILPLHHIVIGLHLPIFGNKIIDHQSLSVTHQDHDYKVCSCRARRNLSSPSTCWSAREKMTGFRVDLCQFSPIKMISAITFFLSSAGSTWAGLMFYSTVSARHITQ